MDADAVKATVSLYDGHAKRSTAEAAGASEARRQGGAAFPLKRYHNRVKLKLLQRFATHAPSLVDLCCGRGGDLNKWHECNVRYVLGIDISPREVIEAKKRFEDLRKSRGTQMDAQFKHVDCLGTAVLPWDRQFDVATCMFAMHYFLVSEKSFRMLLRNASNALKEGGYFITTFVSGKKVLMALNEGGGEEFKSPMLYISKRYEGDAQVFGSAYMCALTDTVTRAEDDGAAAGGDGGADDAIVGSIEYLVFNNVVKAIAREYGLEPVKSYANRELDALFQVRQASARRPYRSPLRC